MPTIDRVREVAATISGDPTSGSVREFIDALLAGLEEPAEPVVSENREQQIIH